MTVRLRDGVAGLAGLQHCGSVWACPVCSTTILTHRSLEIGAVLAQAAAEGYQLVFGTFTMRHRRTQALSGLWAAAGKGWSRATGGYGWVAVQKDYGVEGWVRVWEVTDGRNGWHVHVHFVVVLAPDATAGDADVVVGGMYDRWARGLVSAGLEAPRLVGQEWHLAAGPRASAQLAEYLCKLAEGAGRSLGMELTHTLPGRSRSDLRTRPVWSVLQGFLETGEVEALERWHEWERASKGRRQVGWSRLRERFVPEVEDLDDQAVVDVELGTAEDDLVWITPRGWLMLVEMPAEIPRLLDAAESAGVVGLVRALDELRVPYERAVCELVAS